MVDKEENVFTVISWFVRMCALAFIFIPGREIFLPGLLSASAVTEPEENALKDVLRVEVERAGQGAYGASCWGISGYLDGFHRA